MRSSLFAAVGVLQGVKMSSDFEEYDKPPAPPVRLTSAKYVVKF